MVPRDIKCLRPNIRYRNRPNYVLQHTHTNTYTACIHTGTLVWYVVPVYYYSGVVGM